MSSVDNLIQSIVDPTKPAFSDSQTLVVLNHLSQMKMFGVREGIEFYPDQDDPQDSRKNFLDDIISANKIDICHDRIWDLTLALGQTLFYFRPNKEGTYDIHFYDAKSFKVFYNEESDMERVVIRFSYWEASNLDSFRKEKWIRLSITEEFVDRETFEQMPGFDNNYQSPQVERFKNSLGFIPCEVAKNMPMGKGQDGVGEFERLRSQIESHDESVIAMQENLAFFGHPILVSTRSPSELTEVTGMKSSNLAAAHTAASNSGWYDSMSGSTRNSLPRHSVSDANGIRLKKVVGNVHGDERFSFMIPNAITGDHANYIKETREAIHFALGGIDEIGIHANATAYEMKVVYGKVATTAKKKAEAIYTHCLCKLFEKMIAAEEELFKRSLAAALKKDVEEMTNGFIEDLIEKRKIPNGVFGLPPLGKRRVRWRWTGPVFEESPEDLQKKSIVTRNLQELGVRSLDALTFLFPEKTEKEKQGMLADGYPFRYLNAVAGTTGQLIGLYQQMLNTPDQMNPGVPMSATTPIAPMIRRSLETIYKELNYAKPIDPLSPSESPYSTGGSAYDSYLNANNPRDNLSNSGVGSPSTPGLSAGVSPGKSNANGSGITVPYNPAIPDNPSPLQSSGINPNAAYLPPEFLAYLQRVNPSGFPTDFAGGTRQRLEGSVQERNQLSPPRLKPEYATGLPYAGATVARRVQPTSSNDELSNAQPSSIPIPPDLAVGASQPGSLWSQLFPSFAEWQSQSKSKSSKSKGK